MTRLAITIALLAGSGLAQDASELFRKAPPAIEDALRARITEFYQYHVDGKYRLAEALVAEDTRDFFYSANKPNYLSFEIKRIDYTDDFTKAKAMILCEQYVMMPGFANKPMKVPIPSTWKLVDGKWYWYLDQASMKATPFGVANGVANNGKGDPRLNKPHIPDAGEMGYVFSQVKADKPSLQMKVGETDQVVLHNAANGVVKLSVWSKPAGWEAEFEKSELKAGEKTKVTFSAKPDAQSGKIELRVDPTTQIIPIEVMIR